MEFKTSYWTYYEVKVRIHKGRKPQTELKEHNFLNYAEKPKNTHKHINDVCDMEYDQDADLRKATFNMLYDESQMLSHGNGYSLEANQGAFADVNITLVACETLFLYFVKNLCKNLRIYKVEESKGLNGFIYDMEHKFIKKYGDSSKKIFVLKLKWERFAVKIE